MGIGHNDNDNKSLGASTPVAPKLGFKTQLITKQDLVNRSSRTPFLGTSISQNQHYQRGFNSEYQQVRATSRFIQSESNNNNNGNSNNNNNNNERAYPSTSIRNTNNMINRLNPLSAKKNPNTKSAHVLSRLNNVFSKTPKVFQPIPQQTHKTPVLTKKSPLATQRKTPVLSQKTPISYFNYKTPLLSYKTTVPNQKSPLQNSKTPIANHKTPIANHKTPIANLKTPLLSHKTPLLNHKTPLLNHKTPLLSSKSPITTHKTPFTTKAHIQATQTQADQKTTNNPIPPTATKTIHSTSSVNSATNYNIQVNGKKYKVLRKLGAGGSAKVYEALESNTTNPVAIKIIGLSRADERTRQSYFNELSILARLKDNRHVVHMFDSEHKVSVDELVIVMEKGDADLSQVIEKHFKSRKDKKYLDGTFIKYHWLRMVTAVNEIHKHGIVHADLKPVNFITTKHNEIKLIDFGIADAVAPDVTSIIRDYQIGTINYMAPESLRNRALDASFIAQNPSNDYNDNPYNKKTVIKYNCKADIWSLGCILYYLVYGRPPFDKYKDFPSKMQAIIDPRYQIEFPRLNNPKLAECMKLCLRYDVKERPSAEELLRHPYLSEDEIEILL